MQRLLLHQSWICCLLLLGAVEFGWAGEAPAAGPTTTAAGPVEAGAETNPASRPAHESEPAPIPMQRYAAGAYVLYTDLSENEAKAAITRLTAMGEMYHQFAPALNSEERGKMPVYLYRHFDEYRRTLGQDERLNAGRYDGLVLRAALDGDTFSLPEVWRVIQHEGWHQFSHRVLQQGGPLPLWLEEGLAEYFGAAVWKDGLLTPGYVDAGAYVPQDKFFVIQPGRLQRVQTRIQAEQFRPLEKLVTMTLADWPEQTNALNHDQVWSLVHFLLHADAGQRRDALLGYLAEVLRNPPKGGNGLEVFRRCFGEDIPAIQSAYEAWWLAQPTPVTGTPSRRL